MAKMGKPLKVVDWDQFEKLVWIPVLSIVHIADILKVSKRTLERAVHRRYKMTIDAYRDQKQGPMRHQLFSAMWKSAISGNVGAQVWMSKNILGWSEKIEQKVDETLDIKEHIVYQTSWGKNSESTDEGEKP